MFILYYEDIIEQLNRQIRLSFCFESNKSCIFSIKKFEINGNHLKMTEIVNFKHRQIQLLHKIRYNVATKLETVESNYDRCVAN